MASYPSSLKSSRRAPAPSPGGGWGALAKPAAPLAFPTRPASPRADALRNEGELARMIESEIIPRLMLAHRADAIVVRDGAFAAVGPRTLESFLRMSVTRDAAALAAFVETLMEGGLPLEEVFTHLLIPAARRLGEDWEEDVLSFTDVTVALSRLHQVVRMLAVRLPPPDSGEGARAICLAPFPGSQHTFGLAVLEDGFRRAGWRTWLDPQAGARETAQTVAGEWFDVFGLGVTCDTPLEAIASLLRSVRAASCNPDLFVMAGGRLFAEHPELAREAGADATARDTRDALLIADKAVRARAFG